LLCTDGFWENVFEVEMELDLAKSRGPSDWLSHMQNRLQERVGISHDNYTAVAILADSASAAWVPVPERGGVTKTPASADDKLPFFLRLMVFLLVPALLLLLIMHLASDNWMHPPREHFWQKQSVSWHHRSHAHDG
jgi:hypothetical protein